MTIEALEKEEILLNKVNDGQLWEIVFNRPEKRNAITETIEIGMGQILDEADADDKCRVVTLTGNGPVFSAGHDLVEAATIADCSDPQAAFSRGVLSPRPNPKLKAAHQQFWWPIWEFPKPLIVGIHGYVGPIASVMTGCADLCIAAEGTKISWEQTRIGGGPGFWEPLLIGFRRAKYIMMMGGWYTAEDALNWGFVNKVVPLERLKDEVREWAEEACRIPPQQIMGCKRGLNLWAEALGLRSMVHASYSLGTVAHGSQEDKDYMKMIREQGFKAGLTSKYRQNKDFIHSK